MIFNWKNGVQIRPFKKVIFILVALFLIQSVCADRDDDSDSDSLEFWEPDSTYGKPCVIEQYKFPLNRCGEDEVCDYDTRTCVCKFGMEYSVRLRKCVGCPHRGELCTSCCSKAQGNTRCIDGRCQICYSDTDEDECGESTLLFATATQIALSVAMLLGVMILISLLYKICSKPRYFASNMHRGESSGETASRPSSSSFQNFFGRLQNRPPQYETEQEWNARQAAAISASDATATNEMGTAPSMPNNNNSNLPAAQNSQILPLAPPAYDGIVGSSEQNIAPPPYSMAIIHIDSNGVLNTGYVMEDNTESRNNNASLGENRQQSKNDCDTIIDDKDANFKSMHI